jgi:hypothetical protein
MDEAKKFDNVFVKRKRACSALFEVVSQEMRSVLVGHLLHPCHELYHVTARLAVAETPEAIDRRRDDEAAVGSVRANGARSSQLGACFLQLDAEHVADLLDRNSLP